MSVAPVSEVNFDVEAGEWPIQDVTVYIDQAEVRRNVSFVPDSVGQTVVTLKGIPNLFVQSSLRSEVVSKNARLAEVSVEYKTETGTRDPEIDAEIARLNWESQRAAQRTARAQALLQKVSAHEQIAFTALSGNQIEGAQTALDPEVFTRVTESGKIYERLKKKYTDEFHEAFAEQQKISGEITSLHEKQQKKIASKQAWVAKVLVEIPEQVVQKKKAVELDLFYLVKGASWYAKYDIRVDKQTEESQLGYFGEVVNGTGENWTEVDVALSTAKPSVGGALPKFPRLMVDINKPQAVVVAPPQRSIVPHMQTNLPMSPMPQLSAPPPLPGASLDYVNSPLGTNRGLLMNQLSRAMDMRTSSAAIPQMMSNAYMPFGGGGLLQPLHGRMQQRAEAAVPTSFVLETTPEMTAVASEGAGSTLFRLQRLVSIESDSKPHKQTIAVIELKALLTHACSPKMSPSVFLKMNTKNDTDFIFLPGPMAVFIDGSFSSDSKMQLVRPRQDFALFLGVDDTVKLTYGPENTKEKNVGGGMMGGAKRIVKSVQRDVFVANNGPNLINICIYMQLPLSKTSKLKVDLKKPNITEKGACDYNINSFNNLETRTRVEPGAKFAMEFKYTLEWPEGEIVELQEKQE